MKNIFLFPASLHEALEKMALGVLTLVTLGLPLFLLPVGQNMLIESKQVLLLSAGVIIFLLWAAMMYTKKVLQVTLSPFFTPLMFLGGSVLVSSIYNQVAPLNQLLGFGGVYLVFVLMSILLPTLLPKQAHRFFLSLLSLPTLLLALFSVAEVFHFGPSKLVNLIVPFSFPTSPLFSLTGSPVLALEFFFLVAVASVTYVFTNRDQGAKNGQFILSLLTIIGAVIGSGVHVFTLWMEKTITFAPPFAVSWSIATDMLKSFLNTLIGVGPDNFGQAYMVLKPVWVNTTTSWNISYTQASNAPLTIFITLGAIGLAAWLWLALRVVQQFRHTSAEAQPLAALVLAGLVVQCFLPPSIVILGIQALALGCWVLADKKTLKHLQMHTFTVHVTESESEVQKVPKSSHFLVYCATVACVAIGGLSLWWIGRFSYAQYRIFLSVIGGIKNDARMVYENQQQALVAYPYSAQFRRDFANTSLLIALSASNRQDLTDQDKQQILSLVQQAIDQAKVATSLEPSNSLNWFVLGRIYSNLIGSAQDAENWAVSAYNQATATAPTDPILRLEVGGLFYRLNQPVQAVQVFEQTVGLKPDWPNAYYNLAKAYQLNKEPEKAVTAYNQALAVIQNDPAQAKIIQDELTAVQKEIEKPKTSTKTTTSSATSLQPQSTQENSVSPAAKEVLKDVTLNTSTP